jgi:predicted esterase
MAHGGGGHPEKFDAFASAIAQQGYLVAAITFPMTNQYAPVDIVYGIADVSNQPGDVSAAVDWLLKSVDDPQHTLYNQFNPTQLAYLGHSLGGQTGLALNRYSCCVENRFKAWILAAPFLPLNDSLFPDHAGPPLASGPKTLLMHGQQDPVAPISDTEALYELFEPAKAYVGVLEAEHAEYLESQDIPAIPSRGLAQDITLGVLNDWLKGETKALEAALERALASGHDSRWEL